MKKLLLSLVVVMLLTSCEEELHTYRYEAVLSGYEVVFMGEREYKRNEVDIKYSINGGDKVLYGCLGSFSHEFSAVEGAKYFYADKRVKTGTLVISIYKDGKVVSTVTTKENYGYIELSGNY
jgi:hypothetical protein